MMKTRTIQGNQPLLLDDPSLIWIVQSGSVALFTVRLINGIPDGERRYLFDAEPGEALLGSPVDQLDGQQDRQFGILAVAIEPAELWEQPLLETTLPNLPLLLDRWVYKLGNVAGLPKSGFARLPHLERSVLLSENQIFQPPADQVLWVRSQQGTARWLGYEMLILTPESGLIPLASGMWLLANSDLELLVQRTSDIAYELDTLHTLLRGLDQIHIWFLQAIDQIETQDSQTELARFHKRQRLNRQSAEATLKELVSVLQPKQEVAFAVEDDLLMVAGAVGKALGITIEPPMESEDPNRMRDPLEAIARASRVRLRRVVLRDNWWQKDCGPIIAYTREDNHPVALLPVSGDHYEIVDPRATATHAAASRRHPVVTAAIAKSLSPTAFIFYRPLPDSVMHAWELAAFAFEGQTKNLLLLLGMGVVGTLAGMVVPLATGILIDTALPMGDLRLLIEIGLGLFFVAIASVSTELVQALATMRLETISEVSMQAAVWDRLLKLKPVFFRQYAIGDLQSRVSSISQIRKRLTGTTLRTILTSFFALLNLGLMLAYSAKLAIVAVVVAIATITFTTISGTFILRKTRPLLELKGEIFGLLVRLIDAVPKLRNAGAEERAFAVWGKKYTQQLRLELSTQYVEDSVTIFNTVMPALTSALLFWTTVVLIMQAQAGGDAGISTGTFLAFSAAFGIFLVGATSLSNAVISTLEVVTLWKRAQPILAAEPEVDASKADPGRLSGRLAVDHVTFRYRDDGPLTLDQVCLSAEPGEFIALVGPSGSGKSTLMRLLLGFDTPSEGTIYYDGQDLAGLDITAVRRQLGVVLQNSRLNAGTIFEIIAANTLITVTEAWEAAEMAGLGDDVRAMPMGMHTFVNEGGTNLSGGQRQRLIIARALALKPQILLFDEATSALDNRTQAIVTESLDSLGVTRIVIAHRLSTIRNADRIYVIQAGRVIQEGSFDELLHQDGLFAQLAARQLGEVTELTTRAATSITRSTSIGA
jgi:NHLM bacteriocin system ABC transporter ATP-binding protein